MTNVPIVPRPAATLILCRDADPGIEVLLLQRTHEAVFMPGAYVFPGGAVDPQDNVDDLHGHFLGVSPDQANLMLDVEEGGLGYLVAALRECFEESGLLLAHQGESTDCLDHGEPELASRCASLRQQLMSGEQTLQQVCEALGVTLSLDRLAYFSRWITPEGRPRRFDTRFFLAVAPPGQIPCHDGRETIHHLWISPQEALERHKRGDLLVPIPTRASLQALVGFADTGSLMDHFLQSAPTTARARPARGAAGPRLIKPGEPSYAEVEKLDPCFSGAASYEIKPGAVTALSPTVRRITAPNPGPMTGPGTNSYLIGQGRDRALIDPGPAMDSHLQAIMEAAEGQLRWILVTHTHPDHSPGAQRLRELTGASVLGMEAPDDGHQDRSFQPDHVLSHGERVAGEGFSLRVLHTPGHASNHLCYLHEDEGLLFSGDHIMQGSTVVINPPDGDMLAYLESLAMLKEEAVTYIAPGHGFLMAHPVKVMDWLIAHREKRENKVVAALRSLSGPIHEEALVTMVYDDVPAAIHPLARRSLLAHLNKLRDEARAAQVGETWALLK